ncbi:MAG: hypothetical protein M1319_00610 [Chloroflexi bacterium]|nr:hypothetical protein [Chloroflexota bacterium]
MANVCGGTWAGHGSYIDMETGEILKLGAPGGLLPGNADHSYMKLPRWFGTGTLLAGSFVFRAMFPFVILGTVAFCLVSGALRGLQVVWVSANRFAQVQPQPAASYLASEKYRRPDGAGEPQVDGNQQEPGKQQTLTDLADEIVERRQRELED